VIGSDISISEEVAALHREALVIDLHNDLFTKVSHLPFDLTRRHAPALVWNPLRLDLDLPKMRAAGVDGLGCALFSGFRLAPRRRFWRTVACVQKFALDHPDTVALVDSARGLTDARARGQLALFMGVEGSYVADEDPEPNVLRLAHAGVRTLGPLWERTSRSGSSCRSRHDRGLTDAGRTLVMACERSGIALDVAHASRKTFWDMLDVCRLPLYSSHAGAAALHAHPRNLDDEQIRAIARKGGVVGVIFVSTYLGGTFTAHVSHIADHIEHVAAVGGEDCVALGSDYDGFMPLVRGMRDAADLPRVTELLWRRGWRAPQLHKLLGENALRFFERAWTPR
jgi:membrane dipeptidase